MANDKHSDVSELQVRKLQVGGDLKVYQKLINARLGDYQQNLEKADEV